MSVREIARDTVVTVAPDDTVDEVVATMIESGVGSVVVVENGRPVGIITDRDVMTRVHGADLDASATTASGVMTDEPVTVAGDEGVYDLLRTMATHGVRRVPLVEDGELAGIVTLDDVLLLLSMELQSVAHVIRAESPPFEIPAARLYDEFSE